ncbi:hypothetical protein BC939DRAFT_498866 [Gamsiella multidivaricata]|uniref:uncharacterized protein n=1 Tax=Gamsiella multidivaricata TaxID=101098 RepID=UPI002220ACCC|nr:uncharacterized protein BC939DRAFT_498866 [Gamsiella multidivaricata]KAG0369415.1 hypothetical protein BGZ54_010001 [Gamsiella multidivaricata]KAI7831417.1 hypothetical protein BC939DRAFT_498866 [Gamsiella multidivaricata]
MFLGWSILAINVTLAVFKLLLLAAVNATLAIFSRFGGEYATSIRWARYGGYPEMCYALVNSRKTAPNPAKAVVIVAFFSWIIESSADKIVLKFVSRTVHQTNNSYVVTSTPQFINMADPSMSTDWSRSLAPGENVVDIMGQMINDTRIIPGAVSGRTYTPRKSEYEIECDQFRLILSGGSRNRLPFNNSGCADILIQPYDSFGASQPNTTFIKLSSDRWSLTTTRGADNLSRLPVSGFNLTHGNWSCSSMDKRSTVAFALADGLIDLPKTITSKHVFPSGEISVMTVSLAWFASTSLDKFRNVSTAIFDDYNKLFQGMETLVSKTPIKSNTTVFMEARAVDSTVDILTCFTRVSPTGNKASLACLYNSLSIILLKRQEANPIILESLRGEPYPIPNTETHVASITYLPEVINGTARPLSLSAFGNGTTGASKFFASLGQNFLQDWHSVQLHILYDTTDPEVGMDVPDWLVACALATMGVCLLLIGSSCLLDKHYTCSPYKFFSMKLASRMNASAPMLMRCKLDPLQFEGIQAICIEEKQDVDARSSKTSLSMTL